MAQIPITAPRFISLCRALKWAYRDGDTETIEAVERMLDSRLREYVRVKFAKDYEHMDELRRWVLAGLPTCMHKGRGIQKMILHHFGQTFGVKSLQRDLRCTTTTALTEKQVLAYLDVVKGRMEALHAEVRRALEPLMTERGWL